MGALPKFLLRAAAFGAFTCLVYLLLVLPWGAAVHPKLRRNLVYPRGGSGDMWTRINDLHGHPPVDVLVLGSSHAYRGFDPRAFAQRGLSLYNLGSSGQSMVQTSLLMDRYLNQLDPKLTIIEVYPGAFKADGVESTLDLLANAGVDLPMARMAVRTGSIKALNTLIYATERQLLGLDAGFTEHGKHMGKPDQYVAGGFVGHNGGSFNPKGKAKPEDIRVLPEQLEAFRHILQRLAEQHRKVVLVEAPVSHWRYAAFRDHRTHEQRMASMAPYLNFNGLPGLSDSVDFFDSHHLNLHGVALFNQALLDSLEHHGLLPRPDGPSAH